MPVPGPDHLRIGIREIDADMEGLCFLLRRIFEPLVECRRRHGQCNQTQCARIAAIMAYVDRHFSRQEGLMDDVGYPGVDGHAADHQSLLSELRAMRAGGVCGDRDRRQLSGAISNWMRDHVQDCDRPFSKWMAVRQITAPAE